ncbi:hypothetical protein Taro_020049 [Colocasia esculenta]|uniref:Uncharacterized protein n=1 Tax=Colocasia esculenta TaxID=4460 RepID=A0A843UXV7_COLES|nr:hypothetical protein [Colocasia esculenta]
MRPILPLSPSFFFFFFFFFFLLLPLSSSHAISRQFFMLVVLVLRWCHPVRVGDMLVVLGARRRWPFRCEGPNGSALLVEGSLHGRLLRDTPSAEDATAIEVVIGHANRDIITMLVGVVTRSRRLGPPRQCRDRVGRRDMVATARCVVTSAETGHGLAEFRVFVESSLFPLLDVPVAPVLDSGVESFTELSWLAWDTEDGWSSTRCRLASPFLTASLFAALEPPREARRGTVRLLSSGKACAERRR